MCLSSCWNKKQNWKSYLPVGKHSGFDLNLSFGNNLPCENCCFVGCSVSTRQKDNGTLKIPSARYLARKRIDEVIKSRLLNETSLESKKFNIIKYPKIDLNYIILQTFQEN